MKNMDIYFRLLIFFGEVDNNNADSISTSIKIIRNLINYIFFFFYNLKFLLIFYIIYNIYLLVITNLLIIKRKFNENYCHVGPVG